MLWPPPVQPVVCTEISALSNSLFLMTTSRGLHCWPHCCTPAWDVQTRPCVLSATVRCCRRLPAFPKPEAEAPARPQWKTMLLALRPPRTGNCPGAMWDWVLFSSQDHLLPCWFFLGPRGLRMASSTTARVRPHDTYVSRKSMGCLPINRCPLRDSWSWWTISCQVT